MERMIQQLEEQLRDAQVANAGLRERIEDAEKANARASAVAAECSLLREQMEGPTPRRRRPRTTLPPVARQLPLAPHSHLLRR
jgi:hypothetical protein